MSAYAPSHSEPSAQPIHLLPNPTSAAPASRAAVSEHAPTIFRSSAVARVGVDELIDWLAERVAEAIAARLRVESTHQRGADWLDSRRAAQYLGLHRDTLRRLAAERAIPAEQEAPGCKLYFRRAALDDWRRSGGRPAHVRSTVAEGA